MSVQISVHTNVKKLDPTPKEFNENSFRAFVIDDSWKDRIKNLEEGAYYVGTRRHQLISYSSTTHNNFRSILCKLIGKEWNYWQGEVSKDTPFYELLEFADNEGCMDWESAAELYKDFIEYQADALTKFYLTADVEIYNKWLSLLAIAKLKNSVIVFS